MTFRPEPEVSTGSTGRAAAKHIRTQAVPWDLQLGALGSCRGLSRFASSSQVSATGAADAEVQQRTTQNERRIEVDRGDPTAGRVAQRAADRRARDRRARDRADLGDQALKAAVSAALTSDS